MNMEHFKVGSDEITEGGSGGVIVQECKGRREKSA
jgi:formylmethanofuran dehydrogenase subunit A